MTGPVVVACLADQASFQFEVQLDAVLSAAASLTAVAVVVSAVVAAEKVNILVYLPHNII